MAAFASTDQDGRTSGAERALERAAAGHDPSLADLYGHVALVEARVRAAVDRRRAADAEPDDRFRGLYISDAQVDELLEGPARTADADPVDTTAARARLDARAADAEGSGADLRLRRLARSFGLDEADTLILLVAIAPDLDARFERLYAYLHDDVSRRRASAGLALELAGDPPGGLDGRRRLAPGAVLVSGGLVIVEEPSRPFLTRALRVPDRVTAHLLGDDRPEPELQALALEASPTGPDGTESLARSLEDGTPLCYLRERPGSAGLAFAAAAIRGVGQPALGIDLERLGGDDPAVIAAEVIREARLRGAVVLAGPLDPLAERGAAAVRAFAEAPCQVVLIGTRGWDPGWSREVPLVVEVPLLAEPERRAAWDIALGADIGPPDDEPRAGGAAAVADLDPVAATAGFRLDPEQIRRAAIAARRAASSERRPLVASDLTAGARAQNAGGLERLARRVQATAAWTGLVLPPDPLSQLHELTARVRHRERVLNGWGLAGSGGRGSGVTALFAGDSGTGKTLSAEVVAAALGLDLYVIDLATVVDKYIGETEKNLDRIFAEADRINGVLLFDEADAIFGKRSEVKDARDRYANVEIAYLLQRMERFDGLAVLTTNLRANLDEAFLRRLDVIVDFPMPEEGDRRRLWELHLPPSLPRADDIDVGFLARAFKLSGGNIRNVCLAAAFLAAADERPVSMTDLVRATEREYQKLGRLTHEAEFGEHFGRLARQPT